MKILGVMLLCVMLMGCNSEMDFGLEQIEILESLCSNSGGVEDFRVHTGMFTELSVKCNDMSYHEKVLIIGENGWKVKEAYQKRVDELLVVDDVDDVSEAYRKRVEAHQQRVDDYESLMRLLGEVLEK